MHAERARERDLHRYYQPWKNVQSLVDVSSEERGNAWGLTYEGYRPRASGDKALTAFAQLAALRLNVRRAMVSLIDSTHQIILAEATRTLSLVSDQRHEPGDEVWLGNTIINRYDAVCFNSLGAQYTAKDKEGRSYTSDAFVVPDLRLHDNFKDKDYVKGDPGVKFYAGVPIKTKSGHRIGVYAVSDEKPRFGLDIDELMFMEDVAATVMEHLEMAKDRDDRHKGERMVRGLANFIEGSTDAPEPPSRRPSRTISRKTSLQELKVLSPRLPAVMERQTKNAKLENEDTAELLTMHDFTEKKKQEEAGKLSPPTDNQDPFRVFARAAQIIRDSTAADGVVFFNTNARAFSDSASPSGASEEHGDESHGQTSGSDLLSSEATVTNRPRRRRQNSNLSTQSEQPSGLDTEADARKVRCEVAGLSKTEGAEGSSLSVSDFVLTEERMERYIRNFPYGKFFTFSDNGSGISSSGDEGSQEDISTMLTPKRNQSQPHRRPQGRVKSRKKEPFVPTELLRILPGIRSLIFLPLWDFTEGKYIAGGFIWTTSAGRLMSPDHELPYLKAFGNSVMSEVARVNAQRADFAKTTFIASISHELRSPLHGILGSVEFLHDTAANAYQAALFTSIDTCGRTLLDTIDHVLDYAKINKLRKGGVKRNSRGSRLLQKPETGSSVVGLTADFDLAGLVEEVVDAVTAGHAFKKTHSESIHDHDDSGTVTPASSGKGTSKPREDPAVILNIDHRDHWFVRTQPGALRRITMNLLGNALKYTDSGFVSVSLQLDSEDDNGLGVRLRFVDSGKGMSVEFQRTKLFAPFSQEDPFAAGTGLGLSIVRQIVDSLNGSINVRSTQNVGTEIDVIMHLPVADQPSAVQLTASVARATRGLHLYLSGVAEDAEESYFSNDNNKRAINNGRVRDSLHNTCSTWFGMQVTDRDCRDSEGAKDTIGDADVVCYPERPASAETFFKQLSSNGAYGHGAARKRPAPVIVICNDASQASSFRSNEAQRLRKMGVHVEPVTQPCGPRKMAAVLQKCLDVINDRHGQTGHFAARKILQSQYLERNASAPEILTEQDTDSDSKHDGSPLLLTPSQSSVDTESSVALGLPASRDTVETATAIVQRPTTAAKPQQHLPRLDDIPPTVRSSSAPDLTSQPTAIAAISPASNRPRLQSHESAPMAIDTTIPPPPGPRILLVDDNAINLQLLVMFMKKHKFDFACASNGLEALEKYKEATPKSSSPEGRRSSKAALFEHQSSGIASPDSQPADPEQRPFSHILMDLSMPIMDGLTSTRHIRSHESSTGVTPPATVIALTGLASAEAQEDALAAGVDRFLVKPVRLGQLKGLLLDGDR